MIDPFDALLCGLILLCIPIIGILLAHILYRGGKQ
jgi:hypothetical protein